MVTKVCGNNAYEVEDRVGQKRIYNQNHLKRRFLGGDCADWDWQEAYDAAADRHRCNSAIPSDQIPASRGITEDKGISSEPKVRRRIENVVGREPYNLRSRVVPATGRGRYDLRSRGRDPSGP